MLVVSNDDEIELRAAGPEKRKLLCIVTSELDAINATYDGLDGRVFKWIPCVCKHCSVSLKPGLFDERKLLKRKRDSVATIECPADTYEMVDVLQMLEGFDLRQFQSADEHHDGRHYQANSLPDSLRENHLKKRSKVTNRPITQKKSKFSSRRPKNYARKEMLLNWIYAR